MSRPEVTIREGEPAPKVPPKAPVVSHPTKEAAKAGKRRLCIAHGDAKNRGRITLAESLDYDGLIAFLREFVPDGVPHKQYEAMTKDQRDKVKCIAWFCLARFKGDRRNGADLVAASAIVIDLDGGTPALLARLTKEGGPLGEYAHIIHSTRSHTPEAPRVRPVLPLKENLTRDEHEAVARIVAFWIDPTLESVDPKSFDAEQLWFRSACGPDVLPVFHVGTKGGEICRKPLDGRAILESWGSKPLPTSKREGAAAPGAVTADGGDAGDGGELHGLAREARGEFDWTNPAEIARLRSAMRRVPADKRETWLWMLAALHHAFDGSAEGYELAREWSEGSDYFDGCPGKFDAADQERTWQGFNTKRGIAKRVGSIFYEARANYGWTDPGRPRAGSEGTSDADWKDYLARTKSGYRNTIDNITLILERDARFEGIRYNTFKEQLVLTTPIAAPELGIEFDGLADPIHGDPFAEYVLTAIGRVISAKESRGGYGIAVKAADLALPLAAVGHKRRYSSAQEWLEKLPVWDGVPRLAMLFHRYCHAENSKYDTAVGTLHMVAHVARIYRPGCKYDHVVVLGGEQDLGKSFFIAKLTEMLGFTDLKADFSKVDRVVENLKGNIAAEIPELSQFGKTDVETIKALITTRRDTVRLAYGRLPRVYERVAVLWGTTNKRTYLRDETGNRRILPVLLPGKPIDLAALERDREQIWAETLHRYKNWSMRLPDGSLRLVLTDEAAAEAKRLQDAAMVHTPAAEDAGRVQGWLDEYVSPQEAAFGYRAGWDGAPKPNPDAKKEQRQTTCVADVAEACFPTRGRERTDRERDALSSKIGTMLTELGWHKHPDRKKKNKRPSESEVGKAAAKALGSVQAWFRHRPTD